MRRRIQQLANGKFDYTGPSLSLSTNRIELEVLEGADETGDFIITGTNHVKMRGIVYSSNPRMECLTPQFEGEEVRIRYQFHSEGLVEGDIQKGDFTIVCNQGEYNLSFVASIFKRYADSSIGKIRNLDDFSQLARENFQEAYRLFYSPNFPNLFKSRQVKEALIYEGIRREGQGGQRVEEFLIGAGYKKPVIFQLASKEVTLHQVTTTRKEEFEVQKDIWGYVELSIYSDAEFLQPEKNRISTEEFLGSSCFVEYVIDAGKMHAGKNYGRIFVEYPGGCLCYEVTATASEEQEENVNRHRELGEGRVQLMQLYVDYRLKKIVTGVWAKRSAEIIDHFLAMGKNPEFYSLMKAQALLINKQKQEATWILEDFKREYIHRNTPIWGYYLYLCMLMEREESYVNRMTEEIEAIFHRYPENSLLFWILLFLREDYYQNGARRLKAIERWIMNGNDSPYLYLEAYYQIWQDPYLLVKLGKFEIKILNWARKQGALSKDIVFQIMNLIPEQREFVPQIYQLLCACYEKEPSDELLSDICGYLIKGQKFGKEYHEWYALGIEKEIRITNLYEAFLLSMDGKRAEVLPKMIQMYFQYQNNLSYRQMAVLYVNIIHGKAKQPDVYQKYRRTMEQFAMEQIEAGHIDDNLAIVYEEMLSYGILNAELAHKLAKLLFVHRISCPDMQIAQVMVIHKQLKQIQVVPVVNDVAYIQVYSPDYVVVLLDNKGNSYVRRSLYQDDTLMNPKKYFAQCMKLAPEEVPYQLFYMAEKERYEELSDYEEIAFSKLLQNSAVTDFYKGELVAGAVSYYERNHYESGMEKHLSYIELGKIPAGSRRHIISLLVEMHLYEQAYSLIEAYGYDYLGAAAKVALCSYAIKQAGFEEDDFLLEFAAATFAGGKYNDVILIYLCKLYNGPSKFMAEVWKAAGEFEIDTFDLEERILTQMLYSTDYIDNVDGIYESYCNAGGRELVCMAYISYFSHYYIMEDMLVGELIFLQIQDRILHNKEVNDACKIGLLKYYSEQEKIDTTQHDIIDKLLLEYTCKNMYFAFYKKFDKSMILKYHMNDKYFLEYHGKPGSIVALNYSYDGNNYIREEMTEVYDGVFVKEFLMFFGESVQYYIGEDMGTGKAGLCESDQIINNDVYGAANNTQYAMLNEILLQVTLEEKKELKRKMKEYHGMKCATEDIFTML